MTRKDTAARVQMPHSSRGIARLVEFKALPKAEVKANQERQNLSSVVFRIVLPFFSAPFRHPKPIFRVFAPAKSIPASRPP